MRRRQLRPREPDADLHVGADRVGLTVTLSDRERGAADVHGAGIWSRTATTLTFQLTVDDDGTTPSVDTVTITVNDGQPDTADRRARRVPTESDLDQ